MCRIHVAMGSPGRPGISYNSIWQFPGGKYSAVKYNGVGVVYSTATPQLLRKLSAAGWGQTPGRSLFSFGKHVGSGDADFQGT